VGHVHLALNMVSRALREVLVLGYRADPVVDALVGTKGVVFTDPGETAKDTPGCLSLWLYRVMENGYLRNIPAEKTPGSTARRQPPLALDLHYLLTPFTSSAENDQILLSSSMRLLHDNAIVYVQDPVVDTIDEIRVMLGRPEQAELTGIWEALHAPYRLSVTYVVRVVRIDSTRVDDAALVVDVRTVYSSLWPRPATAPLEIFDRHFAPPNGEPAVHERTRGG
jgi:Pvc16 N-terminal domain